MNIPNAGELYWHFLPKDGRLQFAPHTKVEVGVTLRLPEGERPEPCAIGFHASKRAIDALAYAPGALCCRVTLGGEIIAHGVPIDKYCASERTVIVMADASDVLVEFNRWCALQVIDLWEPEQVTLDYLHSGDEALRERAHICASAYAYANTYANTSTLAPTAGARAAAHACVFATAGACVFATAGASVFARTGADASARAIASARAGASVFANAREGQNVQLESMLLKLLQSQ